MKVKLLSGTKDITAVWMKDDVVKMIDQRDYDLIISDIKMPGKTGYEIFAPAKEKSANLPVILMTGFGYAPNP